MRNDSEKCKVSEMEINEANKNLLPSCEKLSNLFIAWSHHANMGFPNGVTRIKMPKKICNPNPHIINL